MEKAVQSNPSSVRKPVAVAPSKVEVRHILALKEYYGMTYRELAPHLGVTTVNSLVNVANGNRNISPQLAVSVAYMLQYGPLKKVDPL